MPLHFPAPLLAALAILLAAAPRADAIPRPLNPTAAGAAQPKLLTDYERQVLSLEMAKLQREIRTARNEARQSDAFAALRAAVDAARAGGVPTNVAAATAALDDAVETALYEDPAFPAKIKRLLEVGNLLEYDSRLRREQRVRQAAPRPRAPAPPAPAGGDKADAAAPAVPDSPAPATDGAAPSSPAAPAPPP